MLTINSINAEKIRAWIADGGIAVWHSINLSNPGGEWITKIGAEKPTWQAGNEPEIIKDESSVLVSIDKEMRRFHVALRRSGNGLSMKCTDASSRKIRAAVDKAGEGAYHVFDYDTQEAVIMAPEKQIPLNLYNKEA